MGKYKRVDEIAHLERNFPCRGGRSFTENTMNIEIL
jgi:hypothetical protein